MDKSCSNSFFINNKTMFQKIIIACFSFWLFTSFASASSVHDKIESIFKNSQVINAPSSRDFAKRQIAWWEKSILPHARQNLKGKSYEELALRVIEQGLKIWTYTIFQEKEPSWVEDARALIRSQCDEPVALYLAYYTIYQVEKDELLVIDQYNRVKNAFTQYQGYPEALRSWILTLEKQVYIDGTWGNFSQLEFIQDLLASYKKSLQNLEYAGEDQELFVRTLLLWAGYDVFKAHYQNIAQVVDSWQLDEWAKLTIQGASLIEKMEAQDQPVQNKEAMRLLTQAWELKPQVPVAAGYMIRYFNYTERPASNKKSNGLIINVIKHLLLKSSHADDPIEKAEPVLSALTWYERSAIAECDYNPAMYSLKNILSAEQEKFYYQAAISAPRYDSDLAPMALNAIGRHDWAKSYKRDEVYQEEDTWRMVEKGMDGLINEPSRANMRPRWLASKALVAWLAGRYEMAAQSMIDQAGKLHPSSNIVLQSRGLVLNDVLGELQLYRAGKMDVWQQAKKDYQDRRYVQAKQLLNSIQIDSTNQAAVSLIKETLELCEMESALEKEDWVSLPIASHLAQWRIEDGNWNANNQGQLILDRNTEWARIFHRARMPESFQINYTYRIDMEESCGAYYQVNLNVAKYLEEPTHSFSLIRNYTKQSSVQAYWRPYNVKKYKRIKQAFQTELSNVIVGKEYKVEITIKNHQVSWKIDGKSIVPADDFLIAPYDQEERRIVFEACFISQAKCTFSDLKVRNLEPY